MQIITKLKSTAYEYYIDKLTADDTAEVVGLTNVSKAYKTIYNGSPYWIASRYVITKAEYAYFGVRYMSSGLVKFSGFAKTYGDIASNYTNVRPVVILKSEIQLTGNSTDGWIIE